MIEKVRTQSRLVRAMLALTCGWLVASAGLRPAGLIAAESPAAADRDVLADRPAALGNGRGSITT